jgi:hypothetical protein
MEVIQTMSTPEKVKLILSLFKTYQPILNIVEQIALLTTWIESCVDKEEYEMAEALTKELKYIQKNPNEVKQRTEGELDKDILYNNPLSNRQTPPKLPTPKKEVKKKQSLLSKLMDWFKSFRNGK